jgi:type IV pilus assembly protein PilE
MKSKRLPAWTMMETLIVLAVIGILVLLILPNFSSVISKAKAKEAELQLNALYLLQKSHFYERSKYSDSFESIGFIQEPLVTEGGNANYKIEIVEVSYNKFTATATAVVDFDGDGIFNVWQINDQKELIQAVPD